MKNGIEAKKHLVITVFLMQMGYIHPIKFNIIMGTTIFKYSKWGVASNSFLFSFLAYFVYGVLTHPSQEHHSTIWWIIWFLIFLYFVARLFQILILYLVPLLQNKTAIELDEEKMQLYLKDKFPYKNAKDCAYWADIADIKYKRRRKRSPTIIFTMKDGSIWAFDTSFVAGDNKEIFNTIVDYYNNQLTS